MGRTEHAARWLRARWQRAGWAEGAAVLVGRPVFVWLTRRGQQLAGLEYKLWRPSPGRLAHVQAVAEVRLWVAARRPESVWVPERELARDERRGAGIEHGHRPDGLVRVADREAAVEVELTLKKRARVERIVHGNLARYESLWYFAAPEPRRAVEAVAQKVGRGRVHVMGLPSDG